MRGLSSTFAWLRYEGGWPAVIVGGLFIAGYCLWFWWSLTRVSSKKDMLSEDDARKIERDLKAKRKTT